VTVCNGPEVFDPHPRGGHVALISGRREQRAGRCTSDTRTASIPYFVGCHADSFGDVAHRVDTAEQGIGGQPAE
jgi:hypothetical protein